METKYTVGNYIALFLGVSDKGAEHKICQITGTKIEADNTQKIRIDYTEQWYDLFSFEPIPLTEEWMLRFGFIRKYVSHTPYMLNDISIYPTDANFYNIVYYKGVKIDDIILKSVSQLQNLYFSLTNNELKLIK